MDSKFIREVTRVRAPKHAHVVSVPEMFTFFIPRVVKSTPSHDLFHRASSGHDVRIPRWVLLSELAVGPTKQLIVRIESGTLDLGVKVWNLDGTVSVEAGVYVRCELVL